MTTQVTFESRGVMTVETRAHRGRAYVAEIVGTHPQYGLDRAFRSPFRDCSRARTTAYRDLIWRGSVRDGQIYEISSRESSSSDARYYYVITGGSAVEISREDAGRMAAELQAVAQVERAATAQAWGG